MAEKKPLSKMSIKQLYSYRVELENELTNVLWYINLRKKAARMGNEKKESEESEKKN